MNINAASPPLFAAPQDTDFIIRMQRITKRFPGVIANRNVDLSVRRGAFHAVIGENGAGKSTLLNILYGRYCPDAGRLFLAGEEVTATLHSPADAIRRGLALVSQHYSLIPALTVLENLMLGAERTLPGGILRPKQAAEEVAVLADRLGLTDLDLNARTERLSVAAQQKIEILKTLYRGVRILLLDEPTATLAPQEVDALFRLLHTLIEDGATILFVTHKLREVMAHSTEVTVLRGGRSVASFATSQTNVQELLLQMIGPPSQNREMAAGDSVLQPKQDSGDQTFPKSDLESGNRAVGTLDFSKGSSLKTVVPAPPVLVVEGLSVRGQRGTIGLREVNLSVEPGEILGVAGVDGSGQRELSEALVGLRRSETGRILLADVDVTRLNVRRRADNGLAYIPEDRHRAGMILDFTVSENYLLGHEFQPDWGGGILLHPKLLAARASKMLSRYDVRVGLRGADAPGRTLSGGNQQKVVVARALESRPRLLVACQPTRGLDVAATRFVYELLLKAKADGLGVLLFSLDLDEVFELSDRIAVLFNGRLAGILPRTTATRDRVGELMTGTGQRQGRGKREEGRERGEKQGAAVEDDLDPLSGVSDAGGEGDHG